MRRTPSVDEIRNLQFATENQLAIWWVRPMVKFGLIVRESDRLRFAAGLDRDKAIAAFQMLARITEARPND